MSEAYFIVLLDLRHIESSANSDAIWSGYGDKVIWQFNSLFLSVAFYKIEKCARAYVKGGMQFVYFSAADGTS